MTTEVESTMTPSEPISAFEAEWNKAEKILIRGKVTKEASDFLEEQAFKDFGMMKKGAIGLELTKLLLIAKETLEKEGKL